MKIKKEGKIATKIEIISEKKKNIEKNRRFYYYCCN